MSALVTKLSKDWQLIPLAASMVFGCGLAGYKMWDKVANDQNINLSTKTSDVANWEDRAKLNTKSHHDKIMKQSIFSQR